MKALSIKQPWASLIAHGIKDIENRTWKTKFRGRIYIHASGQFVKGGFEVMSREMIDIACKCETWKPLYLSDLPTSAIIGEVDIIDCVINHSSIWAEKASFPSDSKPIWNWVLANAVLYEKPILNVKGKLSFWEPDTIIEECIWCSGKFDFVTMCQDNSSENYCPECWKEALPIMKAEYDEMVRNGEIEEN